MNTKKKSLVEEKRKKRIIPPPSSATLSNCGELLIAFLYQVNLSEKDLMAKGNNLGYGKNEER